MIGVLRTLPSRAASWIGFAYVEFFRNMPLLVQLFLWFFVLPELLPRAAGTLAEAASNLAVLGGDNRASACSCRRASRSNCSGSSTRCRAVKQAATALGLTTVRPIEAGADDVRIILPPLTSQFLDTIKYRRSRYVGLIKLTGETRSMQEFSFQVFEAFTAATVLYLLINLSSSGIRLLERQVAITSYVAEIASCSAITIST